MASTPNPSYREGLAALRDDLRGMLPDDALALFDSDASSLDATHSNVLKVSPGDAAPAFTLSNATGEPVSLYERLVRGPVVLTFYRGSWCPYCNLYLSQLQTMLTTEGRDDVSLLAVSPQTPDESLSLQEKLSLAFEVLSDVGNQVARQFTTVFRNGEAPVEAMTALGIDFDAHYGDDSRELPVPATFVIRPDGIIAFAKSEGGDYRERVEPAEFIAALQNLKTLQS